MFDFDGIITLGLYDNETDGMDVSPARSYLNEVIATRQEVSNENWGLGCFNVFWKFWVLGSHNHPTDTLAILLVVFEKTASLDPKARGYFSYYDDERKPETPDGLPVHYLLHNGKFWLARGN